MDLRTARARRDAAKSLLRLGQDPSAAKKLDQISKRASRAETFAAVASEVAAKKLREGKSPETVAKFNWLVGFALPDLGKRPISEISSAEVLATLRKLEARGRHESANRMRSVVGQVFPYAIATARCANDPTGALRGALTTPTVTSHAAILDPTAFGGLLRAIDDFQGQPTTRAALQLMALLFPRPGEMRFAEWREIDTGSAIWTIPAARMKMDREHLIPLPRRALGILAGLREISAGKLLFPSLRTVTRPISEGTMNAALRRMGHAKDEMTPHGFRATASTALNESGLWHEDAIERALAHIEKNKVRRAYARGEFWDERVRMAQWWADRLDVLRTGAKIIPMKPAEAG